MTLYKVCAWCGAVAAPGMWLPPPLVPPSVVTSGMCPECYVRTGEEEGSHLPARKGADLESPPSPAAIPGGAYSSPLSNGKVHQPQPKCACPSSLERAPMLSAAAGLRGAEVHLLSCELHVRLTCPACAWLDGFEAGESDHA